MTAPTLATTTDDALDAAALAAAAMEHCIFPLAPVEGVRQDGPTIFVRGEGVHLFDANGRAYLDMMSSHTRANALGYGNREIADAVAE